MVKLHIDLRGGVVLEGDLLTTSSQHSAISSQPNREVLRPSADRTAETRKQAENWARFNR
jgi:hypothetical protein